MEGTGGILSRFGERGREHSLLSGLRTRAKEHAAAEQATAARTELLQELREMSRQLAAARSRFNCETDFDMIDADILELEALEKRYSCLLKRAKQEQIRAF